MSSSSTRWSGVAAIVGGVLWGVKAALDSADAARGPSAVTDALFFVVPLLLVVGLAGLHARYADLVARVGRAGFIQSFVGLAFLAAGWVAVFSLGAEGAQRIISFGFLILALGLILLGFDTLKSEVLPRWNFLPLAMGVSIPLSVVAGDLLWLRAAISALFGLSWVLLGYMLWSEAGASGEEP